MTVGGKRVAVWSGIDVWIWHEANVLAQSSWQKLAAVGGLSQPEAPVRALAHYTVDAVTKILAVRDGKLFARSTETSATWQQMGPKVADKMLRLAFVLDVPVFDAGHLGARDQTERLVITEAA